MAVDFSMNAMLHRALLRELDRIEGYLETGDEVTARRHWVFFSENLHHHHEGEDEFLWPLVTQRSTDVEELATVDAMTAEHQQLHQSLTACDQDFAGSGPLPTTTTADLKGLRLVLAAHCAHEEVEGEPLLERYVTSEDMAPFHEANRKGKNAMLVMPWIADGGTATDQKVYDVIPPLVRFFVKRIMTAKYRAYFR